MLRLFLSRPRLFIQDQDHLSCPQGVSRPRLRVSRLHLWLWCVELCAEEGILRDTDRTEQAIVNVDPAGVVGNTSNIARRAHRIVQVAQSEADNSEDPQFVDHVNNAVDRLRSSTLTFLRRCHL